MTDIPMKLAAPAARTRLMLEGPIVPTLLRLAVPNLVVNVVLIAVTLLPVAWGTAGAGYAVGALALGGTFLFLTLRLRRDPNCPVCSDEAVAARASVGR